MHLLDDNDIPLRAIPRPYAASLETALSDAPPFDFLLCAGASIIFSAAFLDRLDGRVFNIHPALLPHYRGPVPLHAMLLHDKADLYGGMTLHVMTAGIDKGPIIAQRSLPLSDYRDHRAWLEALWAEIPSLVTDDLTAHLQGKRPAVEQPEGAGSYFSAKQVPLTIEAGFSFADALRFVERAPMFVPSLRVTFPRADGKMRKPRIQGETEHLGPPTGEPAKLTNWHLDIDLSDARVRFKRDRRLQRAGRKVGRMLGC